jgi:ATP-dependent Clp protease protease subunit
MLKPQPPVFRNHDDDDDEPEAPPAVEPAKKEGESRPDLSERMIKARTVILSGPVDDKLAARVIHELLLLEADDAEKPITIYLNSPGGSVTSGFAIYDMMRFVAPRVRVVCSGLTASIGTVILLGAAKEDRLALPNTRLLIHQPLIAGNVYGPASDLEITANEILKTRGKINQLLAAQTGQPLERIEADTQRDYWLTAQEALDYGLISRIVTHRSDI